MANQTLTTTANYDDASLSGLANGENINVNGGTLTINSDVRWNQQAAVFGDLVPSLTEGGTITIDGTTVWELPFSASTGNVPTQAANGSNGVTGGTSGATGELLRVWATGSLTPATAGGAMPSTGFIKLRTKTGDFTSGETVTLPGGATITLSSVGKRSWLHMVGGETKGLYCTLQSSVSMTGDWYELGTTNGSGDQTFQFPVADCCPAIWVETSAGSGTYEIWLNCGPRWGTATQFVSTDIRGKYFGMDNSTGVITIARRSSNSCGYLPPTGCKVRIPNIICSSSNSTDWNANTISATLNTRFRYLANNANGAGAFTATNCSFNWYITPFNGINFSISLTNCGILHVIQGRFLYGAYVLTNCGFGVTGSTSYLHSLSPSTGGVTWTDVRMVKYEDTNNTYIDFTNVINITLTNVSIETFGTTTTTEHTGTSQRLIVFTNCSNVTTENLRLIGAGISSDGASFNLTFNNTVYCDRLNGTTTSTNGQNPFFMAGNNITFNGISFLSGVSNVHPYSRLLGGAANNYSIKDIGTSGTPMDAGSANAMDSIGNCTGNNITYRRIYINNLRSSGVATNNAQLNVLVENIYTPSVTQSVAAQSCTFRGVRTTTTTATNFSGPNSPFLDIFTSDTAGRFQFYGYSAPSVTYSFTGRSGFTGAGGVNLKNVGDFVIWEMAYFALGHTALDNVAPTLSGTNTGNMTYEFQYALNAGSYNGTWLTLNATNLSGVGAITPTLGIKLKVRATCATASSTNVISSIVVTTVTTLSDQTTLYPLPGISLTLTGLVIGTEVRAYLGTDPATATEIDGVESCTGTSQVLYHTNAGSDGYIVLVSLAYQDLVIPITYSSSAVTIPVFQQRDRQYENP